jgi:hypothetical protein
MKLEGNISNNLHQKAERKWVREVMLICLNHVVFFYIEDFKYFIV